jgi:general stress protein YciG
MAQKKNAAAVELGRKGGQAKVPKGLATMSDADKKRIQSAGGKARWKNAAKKKAAK